MKTATIVSVLGVVLIVLVVGFVVFRPQPTQAPTPTPNPQFEDVSESDPSLGEFIEAMPEASSEASLEGDTIKATPTASPAATESVTISIDESGFTPATVTIKAGTAVTFINNGQAKHWPASDVHPTHELLPEFDAKGGLATGETYSHTFTKVGRWPMHDHLAPNSTGTIVVQ